jgi:hypothetical protein
LELPQAGILSTTTTTTIPSEPSVSRARIRRVSNFAAFRQKRFPFITAIIQRFYEGQFFNPIKVAMIVHKKQFYFFRGGFSRLGAIFSQKHNLQK